LYIIFHISFAFESGGCGVVLVEETTDEQLVDEYIRILNEEGE